jgi:hypothetical protein
MRIEFRYETLKAAGLAASSLVFLGTAIYGWGSHDTAGRALTGFSLLLFFAVGPFFIHRFWRSLQGPVIVMDEAGILDTRMKVGTIPWEAITDVRPMVVGRTRLIGMEVSDERYVPHTWQGKLNIRAGLPRVAMLFDGMTPGMEAAAAVLAERLPHLRDRFTRQPPGG